jgi:myosin heavy subunit
VENANADYSLMKLELNKLEILKQRCESLEKELVAAKSAAAMATVAAAAAAQQSNKQQQQLQQQLQQQQQQQAMPPPLPPPPAPPQQQQQQQGSSSMNSCSAYEAYDKYYNEIKLYQAQITNLQNDIRVRDEERKHVERQCDIERQKAHSLISKLEELTSSNTQLTMQIAEAKRKLVSLELLNEECNQLRKNLTVITIESESRKAEITTLSSHLNILESTLKTLRENNEKHSQMQINYEHTVYELKKKQEDYRRLQQVNK